VKVQVVLVVGSGCDKDKKIALQPGQSVRIGRASDRVDFAFAEDSHMSGVHFSVECNENDCLVRDLGSSNGTFVNGALIKMALLKDGDSVLAGDTTFVVNVPESEVKAPAPVKETPEQMTPQQRLLRLLRGEFQPLYALLDAACEPSVLKVLFESKEQYQSLFDGITGAQLTHFAPYLVRVPAESPLLEKLVEQGWGKNWGIYLTSAESLQNLRTHFRQFLMVQMPGGEQAYFRFYDPRVLRVYLPTCTFQESDQFFGPVRNYLMEDEEPDTLLQFSNNGNGALKITVPLPPEVPRQRWTMETVAPAQNASAEQPGQPRR
jgi:pSer/pThr/pTyr-binding forkhead associated (FHA) protein